MTALMGVALSGKLDCLEHLVAKGANLNAQNCVRRGPAAAWRRGVWGKGVSGGGCAPLPRCPAGGRCPAGAAAPLSRRAALPPRCRLPALGRPARMQAGRGASGAVTVRGRGVGWGAASASDTRHPPAHRPRSTATRPS